MSKTLYLEGISFRLISFLFPFIFSAKSTGVLICFDSFLIKLLICFFLSFSAPKSTPFASKQTNAGTPADKMFFLLNNNATSSTLSPPKMKTAFFVSNLSRFFNSISIVLPMQDFRTFGNSVIEVCFLCDTEKASLT